MLYHAEIEIESDMEQEEFREWLIDNLRKISETPNRTKVNSVYENGESWI